MRQLDPKTVMVSFKNLGEQDSGMKPTYVIRYEEDPNKYDSIFTWAALKAKALYDSQKRYESAWTDPMIKIIERSMSKTPAFLREVKNVFKRENIDYSKKEMPTLRKWIHKLNTFPDPERIKQKAVEINLNLNNTDIAKIYWGQHILQKKMAMLMRNNNRYAYFKRMMSRKNKVEEMS
jgi:hypothetical protein